MNDNQNTKSQILCGHPSSKQNQPQGTKNTTTNRLYNNAMNFRQMEKLILEGEPAQHPTMRLVPDTMSKFSKGISQKTPYGTYKTTNYDRYKTKNTTEQDALNATEELRKTVYQDMPQKLEKLADFQGNDDIIRVYDEFISNLYAQAGVKL